MWIHPLVFALNFPESRLGGMPQPAQGCVSIKVGTHTGLPLVRLFVEWQPLVY
jgi:hypothetical protein